MLANGPGASRSKRAVESGDGDGDDTVSTKRECLVLSCGIICSPSIGPRTGELLVSHVKAQAARDLPMANQEVTYLTAFDAGSSSGTRGQIAARAAHLDSTPASPGVEGTDGDISAAGPSFSTRGQVAARAARLESTSASLGCEDLDFDMTVQELIGEPSTTSDDQQISGCSNAAPVTRSSRRRQTNSSSDISSPHLPFSLPSTIIAAPTVLAPLGVTQPCLRIADFDPGRADGIDNEHLSSLHTQADPSTLLGSNPTSSDEAGDACGAAQNESPTSPSALTTTHVSSDLVSYLVLCRFTVLTSIIRFTGQHPPKHLSQVDVS